MFNIILLGLIVSLIGTMIGALIGISIKNPTQKVISSLIAISAGLMLAVVMFDLIPESISGWGVKYTSILSIVGILIIMFVDKRSNNDSLNYHKKVAFMAAIGLMLHNFPEGIIMGCGFAMENGLGIKMAIIIAIHDIPEGIAVAAPLIAGKEKPLKTIFYVFLTALPTTFGTFFGIYLGGVSTMFLNVVMSLASGIMLYVITMDMIPESSSLTNKIRTFIYLIVGTILGTIIINIL